MAEADIKMPSIEGSLKRVFIFYYQFEESRNLSEVKHRLEKNKFVIVNSKELGEMVDYLKDRLIPLANLILPERIDYNNAIIARSLTVHPTMIYFLFLQHDDKGGSLFLFETVNSWYSCGKILHSMRAFDRNAGIRSKFTGLFIPSRRVFLKGAQVLEDESAYLSGNQSSFHQ
ncbi:MAG: hypothetical protein QXT84_02825 [Candidatus Bathyarchaeia archaeon]